MRLLNKWVAISTTVTALASQAFQGKVCFGIFSPLLGNLLLPRARSQHKESDYPRAARHVQVDNANIN